MAGSSRAVRIAKSSSRSSGSASPEPIQPLLPPASGVYVPNSAGGTRARRLFLLFGTALLVMYVGFLALELSGPAGASLASLGAAIALSLVALIAGVVAYTRTIARAPRGVFQRAAELVVSERGGRVTRFPMTAGFRVEVVERHRSSGLSPG